jgi:hypothetical protein
MTARVSVARPAVIDLDPARSESSASLDLGVGGPVLDDDQDLAGALTVTTFGMLVGHEATGTPAGTALGGIVAFAWDRKRRKR